MCCSLPRCSTCPPLPAPGLPAGPARAPGPAAQRAVLQPHRPGAEGHGAQPGRVAARLAAGRHEGRPEGAHGDHPPQPAGQGAVVLLYHAQRVVEGHPGQPPRPRHSSGGLTQDPSDQWNGQT